MVIRGSRQKGTLITEAVIAMAILFGVMIPLSFSLLAEQKLLRAHYNRAVAVEIVDGEMEILAAGEWRKYSQGAHDYQVNAESAANLPPGRFMLTVGQQQIRLEWLPDKKGTGGVVIREAGVQ